MKSNGEIISSNTIFLSGIVESEEGENTACTVIITVAHSVNYIVVLFETKTIGGLVGVKTDLDN